jgi:hypothetical protein
MTPNRHATLSAAFLVLAAMSLAACSQIPKEVTPEPPAEQTDPSSAADPAAPPAEANKCDAAAAQDAVGKVADAEVVEKARVAAGAAVARTLKPGQVVTMEYRFDRLNLRVDAKNVVEAVTCG